jgi:hypothetical protein
LRTSAGGAVADGTYTIKVSLYDQAAGGAPIWKDTFATVAVVGGLFAFELGGEAGTQPLPAPLTSSATPLWFGLAIGADPELPRTAVGWVPRAFWANIAGVAQAVSCAGCIGADQIAAGSIGADKVGFNYAASSGPGGAATSALTATTADTAVSATTAASADVAKDLQCSGCVGLSDLAADAKGAFVLTKGDSAITGNVTDEGMFTIKGALILGSTYVFGGIYTGIGPCDATSAGQLGWNTWAKRFEICDGTAVRYLAECRDQCQAPEKVACGAAIPDICGDTASGCTGTGTYCADATKQCVAGTCQAIQKSCNAIHQADNTKATGTYQIDPDGPGGNAPFSAYCDMDHEGGGWTMVMKINGANQTFNFDSDYWSNATTLNPDKFNFDQAFEHKNAAFSSLNFSAMRVTMWFNSTYQTVAFPMGATSLQALFGQGNYQATYIGRSAWQGMISGGSLLPNCNREGINARPWSNPSTPDVVYTDAFNADVLRARFGILTNGENDCKTPDAVIGFGIAGKACAQNPTTAAGNFAACGASPNNVYTAQAWAYVFIR